MQIPNDLGFGQMTTAMQVLAVDQPQEFGVLQVIVPGERDQGLDRLDRVEVVEVERLFGLANVGIRAFAQRKDIEVTWRKRNSKRSPT